MPTKPWSEIEKKMAPEQIARSDAKADALRAGILIQPLREQLGLTQGDLADRLGITEEAVANMEWGRRDTAQ